MHHILVFPLPMQGPVNSMLKLAELICMASNNQIQVTFLTTHHVQRRLMLHAGGANRFGRHPGLAFRAFDDGLPEDHPRGGPKFMEMLEAVEEVSPKIIKEMLMMGDHDENGKPPITCVIADGLFTFVLDIGEKVGTPIMYFDTISPCCLWVYLCIPSLVLAGLVPFQENDDLDAIISLPGMRNVLRRRDFPDFCRANNPDIDFMTMRAIKQANQFRKAQGIILNTFEALDATLLSYFRSHLSNPTIYAVGPLHLHLKERAKQTQIMSTMLPSSIVSNSLLHEDRNCLEWLDQQCPKSVIFCSFGSHLVITKDQLVEFWYGLVNSKTRFLWVKRPGSVVGMDDDGGDKWHQQIPMELLKGVKEFGFVTSWVPQEEVLSHVSIGGFLTHCGWNSNIESITAGVPMICWSHYVDQLVNSRYVSEVWKVGIDIKDTCDRVIIENMMGDLIKNRKDEYTQEANHLAILAMKSVVKDGSSFSSLNRLINDIKSFKLQNSSKV